MRVLLIYARRHWQAILVLTFFTWRVSLHDFSLTMWITACFAFIGLTLNLLVNLANGGMPAQIAPDQIPEEQRDFYHPISESTRLVWLSDWIPVGNLLISPGDIALLIAVAILLFGPFVSL